MKRVEKNGIVRAIAVFLCALSSMTMYSVCVDAKESAVEITGDLYEFGKNDLYEIDEAEPSEEENNISISINGNVSADGEKGEIPSYAVDDEGSVTFDYSADESLLTESEEEWHLEEDRCKKVNGIELDDSVANGAVILQISNDGEKWVTVSKITDAFAENSENGFYEASELELLNGCYYRIIVAYEVCKRVEDSKILFINKSNYDYAKYAEVFEFYLYDKENYTGSKLDKLEDSEKITLGKVAKAEDEGYSATEEKLDKDDPHFGWSLGKFFVTGFTSKNMVDGKQYILKNVGDTVTLAFYLEQDIDQLNGNQALSISDDKDGYDKDFQIKSTDFGRGTLIVQYTDPDGVTHESQIYVNYLEANLSPKANTAIALCEEGDYDVALDYEIQNDNKVIFCKSIFPEKTHYRTALSFSVRNSNCMVYTFDSTTGKELKNRNITENGFKIDLANSQYLDISVKKEVLEDGAEGLTEDTRFNRKAKDQETYTDEGIYTITVKNKAADLSSEKIIYVGTDKILKAHTVTNLSITEIKEKVSKGATIAEDGTIIEPSGEKVGSNSEVDKEADKNESISDKVNVDKNKESEDR